MRIHEVAQAGIGNEDQAIDVVAVSILHLGGINADDLEALAIDANVLTDGIAAGEQFLLCLRADHRDPSALSFVLPVVPAPLIDADGADVAGNRIFAHQIEVKGAVLVLDGGRFAVARGDMRDLRNIGAQQVDVIERELDFGAGFVGTRLHRRSPRDDEHHLRSERGKNVIAGATEAISVCEEHADGGNPPSHAKHGQRGAAPIVAHRVVGLGEDIAHHN